MTSIDNLFELLADGGVLILADTTGRKSSWREVLVLRMRDNFDCATLDADGGLTVVTKRHNQSPLTSGGLGQLQPEHNASSNAAPASAAVPSAAAAAAADSHPTSPPPLLTSSHPLSAGVSFELFSADRQRALNLLTFEELHRWLAPTGNVDLMTAFGGRKVLEAFRESVRYRERCTAILSASRGAASAVDRAVACFNDALSAGRLSLMGRWQLALLLMSKDKLVDAVTMLGELQGISPSFYKWILTQSSLSFGL